jgi:hypothetical protein
MTIVLNSNHNGFYRHRNRDFESRKHDGRSPSTESQTVHQKKRIQVSRDALSSEFQGSLASGTQSDEFQCYQREISRDKDRRNKVPLFREAYERERKPLSDVKKASKWMEMGKDSISSVQQYGNRGDSKRRSRNTQQLSVQCVSSDESDKESHRNYKQKLKAASQAERNRSAADLLAAWLQEGERLCLPHRRNTSRGSKLLR